MAKSNLKVVGGKDVEPVAETDTVEPKYKFQIDPLTATPALIAYAINALGLVVDDRIFSGLNARERQFFVRVQ